MPASPEVVSSTVQRVPMSSERLSPRGKHHQTVYDDGRSQYIVERRRRSDTVLGANVMDLRHRISPASLQKITPSTSSRSYTTSKDSAIRGNLSSCDGLGKKPSTSKAVVITTATSSIAEKSMALETWANPTPPPTPRITRLPTPDLSDLDETPFCYCDDSTMRAYCRSCRKQILFTASES
jgi:hypothetical protein